MWPDRGSFTIAHLPTGLRLLRVEQALRALGKVLQHPDPPLALVPVPQLVPTFQAVEEDAVVGDLEQHLRVFREEKYGIHLTLFPKLDGLLLLTADFCEIPPDLAAVLFLFLFGELRRGCITQKLQLMVIHLCPPQGLLLQQ